MVRRAAAPWILAGLILGAGSLASADDPSPAKPSFAEGDVIGFGDVSRLEPYLPKKFWDNRDFFFYEGMKLVVGPTQFDYRAPPEYEAATERFNGQARIGPDNSLENFTAGQPFPMEKIDCQKDPQAGVKIMWNHSYQWNGSAGTARFFYSYWDRGEQLPLYYQGTAKLVKLAHRVEPQYLLENGGDLLKRGDKRKEVNGQEVEAPFDARGMSLLTYRYKSSDGPPDEARNDDTWVYVPTMRRVRRITTAQRTDAVVGTDFMFDDLFSFNGIVPQYEWQCLGERKIIGPMNTMVLAYPYDPKHDFGPSGLSFASDRWELRDTIIVRMIPKNSDHPYHHKDLFIDKQTLNVMYSFAYDQKQELWKIIWHNKRWSEDERLTGPWYPGWEGIPKPMDNIIISDIIVNVQTGTGNRIEFWDRTGTAFESEGKVRSFIDVGRLTKGR